MTSGARSHHLHWTVHGLLRFLVADNRCVASAAAAAADLLFRKSQCRLFPGSGSILGRFCQELCVDFIVLPLDVIPCPCRNLCVLCVCRMFASFWKDAGMNVFHFCQTSRVPDRRGGTSRVYIASTVMTDVCSNCRLDDAPALRKRPLAS